MGIGEGGLKFWRAAGESIWVGCSSQARVGAAECTSSAEQHK